MQRLLGFVLASFFVLNACSPALPPRWAEGGANVDIPRAYWHRPGYVVTLLEDGRVFVDGRHALSVDSAGRAFEPDGDAIAVLQPDGLLVGRGDRALGQIGLRNAALPGRRIAWLSVEASGEVIRYAPNGERFHDGVWQGCEAAPRVCTMVTHLIGLEELRARPRVSVGIGIGVGFGR